MTTAAIISTCDRPEMLDRAVMSVRRQRVPVDELIVVNDGASDIAVGGARIVRTGPYAGPSAARNAGAAVATADVLAFLDDDDEWAPEHHEVVVGLIADADVVLSAFERQTRSGGVELRTPPATLRAEDWFVKNQGLQGSNVSIRREAFHRLSGFDERLWCGEDMDLAIRCADLALRYARSTAPTVTYRTHATPRITTPGTRHHYAHRTFLAAHGSRMSPDAVLAFRERTVRLFGVDPGPVPRLVWVLGPPGAGKTTWATRCAGVRDRVYDFAEALTWLDGADLGVRTAKRHIAAAIRAVEGQRPAEDRRLFMTPAYFDPEDLGPLQGFEHIVGIVPPTDRWRAQLSRREGHVEEQHAHEHARWVARFGTGARAAFACAGVE